MTGGYNIIPHDPCPLPQKLASAFSELLDEVVGASYKPLLYCATQLVNGINHIIICHQTLVAADKEEHIVKMVINEPSVDDAPWKIVTIDTII